MARSAAHAVLHEPGPSRSDEFLTVLAEALILSGMAMAVAGSSRPASGGDHEIMHAINQLYPGTASHGELAGLGALFCAHLRGDADQFGGDIVLPAAARPAAAAGRGRPVRRAVRRRGRVTPPRRGRTGTRSLSASTLSPAEAAKRVEEYVRAIAG